MTSHPSYLVSSLSRLSLTERSIPSEIREHIALRSVLQNEVDRVLSIHLLSVGRERNGKCLVMEPGVKLDDVWVLHP